MAEDVLQHRRPLQNLDQKDCKEETPILKTKSPDHGREEVNDIAKHARVLEDFLKSQKESLDLAEDIISVHLVVLFAV